MTTAPSPPPTEHVEPNPVIIILGIALLVFVVGVLVLVLVRVARALYAALRDRSRALPEPAGAAVEAAVEPARDDGVHAPTSRLIAFSAAAGRSPSADAEPGVGGRSYT